MVVQTTAATPGGVVAVVYTVVRLKGGWDDEFFE